MAYRNARQPQSRWIDAKFDGGTCKVCRDEIKTGHRIFWDAGSRTVTCYRMDCCEADGLTTTEWHGSPVSGSFVSVRSSRRIGSPYTAADK
jgi:hypothetical protein